MRYTKKKKPFYLQTQPFKCKFKSFLTIILSRYNIGFYTADKTTTHYKMMVEKPHFHEHIIYYII